MIKKFFVLFFVLFNSMILFANDTHYGLVGNALVPGKFTLIQMKEETIHLTLYDDYFEID